MSRARSRRGGHRHSSWRNGQLRLRGAQLVDRGPRRHRHLLLDLVVYNRVRSDPFLTGKYRAIPKLELGVSGE